MDVINRAFEALAHALRILLEAHDKAHRQQLLQVDRAEAVGNIENALAAVLNAFHSLSDAMDKSGQGDLVNWYLEPALATILVLRNARHHNQGRKVRTMYSYYAEESPMPGRMERYILVDFPAQEEGADTFEIYLSWADLKHLLSLPVRETRIRPDTAELIRRYLATEKFASYAREYELHEDRVFFNVVPLLVNAAARIVPVLDAFLAPRSLEADTYRSLFRDMPPAITRDHEVNCGPIAFLG